ncbi:MAG: VOC family protein [Gemmatimonas sp.]
MRALQTIRQLDYTVIYARDLPRMRHFYQHVMQFPLERELGDQWIEFRVGSNILALTERGLMFDDAPTPHGALTVQLAFRVASGLVERCAQELRESGVTIVRDVADQPWGHRTLFVRDPDGNVLEIYAEL